VIAEQCSSEEEILNMKAALWAVGHIGSGSAGAAWLGRDGVLRAMVNTAQSCPVYSVRATALHALSLVSTTMIGADLLEEYGKLAWLVLSLLTRWRSRRLAAIHVYRPPSALALFKSDFDF